MKLCSKCKQRPAVVFMSNPLTPNAEPEGLCLVCAKELGIKPVDDILKKMGMNDMTASRHEMCFAHEMKLRFMK